jgi:hypothetical protein
MNDIRNCYLPELPAQIECVPEPATLNNGTTNGRRNISILVIVATLALVAISSYFYIQNQKLTSEKMN